jgi:protein-disulfide isomerase
MTSGRSSQRRGKSRMPLGQEPASRRRASPRVLLVAAAVIAIAVVGVALAFVLSGGSSSSVPARGSLSGALPASSEVDQLLSGIPQHGNVLGSPSAPVKLVEYVDPQCPYCREFETQVMPTLIDRYVRPGKVQVEARLLDFVGPDSKRGRDAIIAAGNQNKLFNMMQVLYSNQGTENTGWLSDSMVTNAAASVPGLDVPKLLSERNASATETLGRTYDSQAQTQGVTGTPTIYVGDRGKALAKVALTSPSDEKTVTDALDSALR